MQVDTFFTKLKKAFGSSQKTSAATYAFGKDAHPSTENPIQIDKKLLITALQQLKKSVGIFKKTPEIDALIQEITQTGGKDTKILTLRNVNELTALHAKLLAVEPKKGNASTAYQNLLSYITNLIKDYLIQEQGKDLFRPSAPELDLLTPTLDVLDLFPPSAPTLEVVEQHEQEQEKILAKLSAEKEIALATLKNFSGKDDVFKYITGLLEELDNRLLTQRGNPTKEGNNQRIADIQQILTQAMHMYPEVIPQVEVLLKEGILLREKPEFQQETILALVTAIIKEASPEYVRFQDKVAVQRILDKASVLVIDQQARKERVHIESLFPLLADFEKTTVEAAAEEYCQNAAKYGMPTERLRHIVLPIYSALDLHGGKIYALLGLTNTQATARNNSAVSSESHAASAPPLETEIEETISYTEMSSPASEIDVDGLVDEADFEDFFDEEFDPDADLDMDVDNTVEAVKKPEPAAVSLSTNSQIFFAAPRRHPPVQTSGLEDQQVAGV